ncbi:MAG: PTS sugar transporter subunit IIA [Candidatus Omnitrophica bacterium]|nr:PTS sugar transporter subunit IIA [Candidatus Omnitrophota bacterium]
MSELKEVIKGKLIIKQLPVCDKFQAIKFLIKEVFASEKAKIAGLSEKEIFDSIVSRENMSTTGIGFGLAIPHSRIEGWGRFVLAVGLSYEGIDFDSMDKTQAKIICLMISSADEPYVILQTTAAIIKFLEKQKGAEAFLKTYPVFNRAKDKLSALCLEVDEQIFAKDVIRPVQACVNLNDSIETATRLMHLKHFDVLPVVDDEYNFCGQLTCLDVFQYGMPNFFNNLKTISFVRHIDPFEKYFRIHRNLKVSNFYKHAEPISQDKTLLEIIFELSIKQRSKLFVTNERNKLIGVIDRFTIIDKILVF